MVEKYMAKKYFNRFYIIVSIFIRYEIFVRPIQGDGRFQNERSPDSGESDLRCEFIKFHTAQAAHKRKRYLGKSRPEVQNNHRESSLHFLGIAAAKFETLHSDHARWFNIS
jgi:hypothetical protein